MSEQVAPGGTPGGKPKSWFARHKILTGLGALLGLGIVGSALGGEQPADPNRASSPAASTSASSPKPRATPPTTAAAGGGQAAPAAASGLAFPGKKDRDIAVKPGDEVQLSDWTTTAGALKSRTDPGFGKQLCAPVTMLNRDESSQDYNSFSWQLQSPSGDTKDLAISESNNAFGNGTLAPGGKKTGTLCWDNPGESGTYVVLWQPDQFSSDARGAWVSKR